MLCRRLAAIFVPLFISVAAFATPPVADRADTPEQAAPDQAARLGKAFSVLHAVSQWSIKLSEMADQRAKSDLVKRYAREMATANADADARLRSVAGNTGVTIAPLDPQTEEGKSLLARIKAETALLGSLQGDAFDKEYMTLVTNTQQSVVHLLQRAEAVAQKPEAKRFLGEMMTNVQERLRTAQDIMAKIYGDQV